MIRVMLAEMSATRPTHFDLEDIQPATAPPRPPVAAVNSEANRIIPSLPNPMLKSIAMSPPPKRSGRVAPSKTPINTLLAFVFTNDLDIHKTHDPITAIRRKGTKRTNHPASAVGLSLGGQNANTRGSRQITRAHTTKPHRKSLIGSR